MSEVSGIDDATRLAQARATAPAHSAWVSANAGSGKTFVLSRRVVRLLLAGTDPAKILCLTFTKAAAAEMARRVFAELGRWTRLDDAALGAEIAGLEGRPALPREIGRARRLFAAALDTPGGLKIQTIHAFCERLLHQFPFEANVAGHFEVLDDRNSAALKAEARRALLVRAAATPESELGRALALVLERVSDRVHEDSLDEFIEKRDAVRGWIVRCGDLARAIADLRRELGLRKDDTAASLCQAAVEQGALDRATALRLIDRLLASGSTQDAAAAAKLVTYTASADVGERLDALVDFFFTGRDLRKSFATKGVRDGWPGLDELLARSAERLARDLDRMRTAELAETTAAMLLLADGAIAEYEALKRRRGTLDFEDLIVRTADLLGRTDTARWVQYKLDRGIEHVLIDEGQDTSPRQWQVIERLVGEFFAGEGAAERLRTLFAVGDEKQSIFSFQGAVPARFAAMQRELGDAARAAAYAWADVELHLSFRSVPKILAAVDQVFADPAAHRGLNTEPRPPLHSARRRAEPGRVILWPRYEAPEKEKTEDWLAPLDHLGRDSPEVELARRIADTIAGWQRDGEVLDVAAEDGQPKRITPGSILILTRSRGALTDAINRELKKRKVPIAGADRIVLTEHIAVMDLMALARFVLLPEDDLSLAALLKSPLVGIGEQQLYDLAHDRVGTLWSALEAKAAHDPALAEAKAKLDSWRARADAVDPYSFFASVLAADRGRHAFLRRLGSEAEDVLDEFLAEALAYERANTPSLQGFLAWLEEGESEVKRDPEASRPEVRVMTVHGAKGLEADVVFLVDNGTPPNISNHVQRVLPLSGERDPDHPGPVVWMRSSPQMPERIATRLAEERQRAEEEYRRLLYVGMTRARDRLYVVGMKKQNLKDDGRWHPIVERPLNAELTERILAGGEVEYEWRAEPAPPRTIGAVAESAAASSLPDWAIRPAPPPPASAQRLVPSAVLADAPPFIVPARRGNDTSAALERGRLVHRLLQSLPNMEGPRRADAARRYLAAAAPLWGEADRAALLAEVMAVMAAPAFAATFAPGSRAEVEIAGRVGGAIVAGRIDRLAVTPERVLVVDYKTNRPAPRELAEVPRAYIGQLAVYRAILARLYPDRPIVAALVWTERAELMAIPGESLILAESEILAAVSAVPVSQA